MTSPLNVALTYYFVICGMWVTKSIRKNLKECFKKHRGSELLVLIKEANAIIRGWCEYHKVAVSSKVFGTLDNWLYEIQKKWVKRRTPKMNN